jgi:glyceraldehyde 3-phosphate dehydrogenase
MAVRVGINGFGRIGRSFWRVARGRTDVEVVAVNDLVEPITLAHLMRYDSIRGRLGVPVSAGTGHLVADGHSIAVTQHADPMDVPWHAADVDVVLESTGRFFHADELRAHLAAGARRVLVSMSAPDPDVTLIAGINDHEYDPRIHFVVSPGCCTTNAVAPLLSVIHRNFGVLTAQWTTIHAYDSTHSALHDIGYRNMRMGRAAAINLVPSRTRDTTRALTQAFPDLAGRLEGLAVRVPASIGCAVDLVVRVRRQSNAASVNAVLAAAAAAEMKGYLGYTEEPIVSADIVGATESSVVDAALTTVVDDTLKVFAWYDNEWGFANRLVEVAGLIGAGAGKAR